MRTAVVTMVIAASALLARQSEAATYHINASSSDCTNTGGSGTLGSPWVSLCNAMATRTFLPDDIIELHAGTYQCLTSGFSAACNKEGAGGGVNTVFPLILAGTAGHPIIVENYQNDVVIIDGTTSKTITWSSCGATGYTTSSINVGSVHTSRVWEDPANAADVGTRLTWSNSACGSLAAGSFSQTGGTTLNVRLPDDTDPTGHNMKISVQQADGAVYAMSALSSADTYATIRLSVGSSGTFAVKYAYYCIFFSGASSHITIDGLTVVGCGGSDYGNGIRVVNGNSIVIQNSSVSYTGAEGVAFYGGGPGGSGCDTGNGCGIQTSNNQVLNSTVSHTGRNYLEGNGLNSNLGEAVIVKDCNSCTVKGNTLFDSIAQGIQVTNANDATSCSTGCTVGLDSSNVVIDSNIIHNYGYECTNGCGGRNTAGIQIAAEQASCGGGGAAGTCFASFLIQNNYIYNGDFTGHTGAENPYGITIDDGGISSHPLAGSILNNSVNNQVSSCIDLFPNDSGAVVLRNNAMAKCGLAFVGTAAAGAHIALDQTSGGVSASTHTNNTYWSASSGDNVFSNEGGTTWTRAQIVANFEASAVQADPTFVSDTNLDLQSGSGLRDTGTNTNCPSLDIHGTSRPVNVICDIGGFEFGGGTTPASPIHVRLAVYKEPQIGWDEITSATFTGFRVCLDGLTGTSCQDVGLPTGQTVSDTYSGYLTYIIAFISVNSGMHSLTVEAYNGANLSSPSAPPMVFTAAYK